MQPGLVSIIIPVYNAEKYLRQTIESALQQTYFYKEVILVNDGSTDESLVIAKKYEGENCKVITQPHTGACKARNTGFKISSGEYIQYLDADDLLTPEKIALQIEVLKEHPSSIIHCRLIGFNRGNPVSKGECLSPEEIRQELAPISWLCKGHSLNPHIWLSHRSLIERAGAWDETLHLTQDFDFFTRVILKADKVLYDPDSIAYYRRKVKASITFSAYTFSKFESLYKCYEKFERNLLAVENSKRTRLIIANRYRHFQYWSYPLAKNYFTKAEQKISALGGADAKPTLSPSLSFLARYIGWKMVKRLYYVFYLGRWFISILKDTIASSATKVWQPYIFLKTCGTKAE